MDCKRTRKRLNAYLDGELKPRRANAVREHLSTCPRCEAELDELRRLNEALGALPGMDAPLGFARRVRLAAESRSAGARLVVLDRLRPALAHAALVLVVLAGLWSGLAIGQATSGGAPAAEQTVASDLDLPMDLLSAAPAGSLADVYLTMASVDQ